MQKTTITSLDDLIIANPCSENWEEMTGDERTRHCNICKKNVYNLSQMPEEDALALINKHEGNLCGRLHIRQDGTVIVNDCPGSMKEVIHSGKKLFTTLIVTLLLLTGASGLFAVASSGNNTLSNRWNIFVTDIRNWIGYPAKSSTSISGGLTVGKIYHPSPPSPTPTVVPALPITPPASDLPE